MKKLIALALIASLAGIGGTAEAAKCWDDMSWWGNTGATPEPQPDSKGRSGYWWWPTAPASNAGDTELWGNRGIVYHKWEKPVEEVVIVDEPEDVVVKPPVRTAIKLNNVLFDFDKSTLKPEGKAEIDKLVAWMKKYPQDTVLIEGHTCNVGTDEYNMGLGERRANSVKTYMTEQGIAVGRIATKSFGESQPAVPNDSPANRKLNRRAVFKITMND
jgi:outer membrane protein OmpA-like peptidoglycan-associated protein